ncbi:MAG: hypothetical protein AAF420_08760, partial [Pseudomonadota bacterium]
MRVVFDSKYTSVLLRQGIEDGLVSIHTGEEDPTIKRAVAAHGPTFVGRAQDALWHLVLHEEAFYNFEGVDNLKFSDSAFHEAVGPIPSLTQMEVTKKLERYQKADAEYLSRLLQVSGEFGTSRQSIHELVTRLNDGSYVDLGQRVVQTSMSNTYEEYCAYHTKLNKLELPNAGRLKRKLGPINPPLTLQ